MALRDELVLETRRAFAELDALQGRLDRISDVRLDVNLDTTSLNADLERSQRLVSETADGFREVQGQVTLTTDEYRQAVRLIQDGEDATRAVAQVTGNIAREAGDVEDAYRRVAAALDLSEDDAQQLATAVGRSTVEASELDADLRRVARSMGLSEQEASQFTAEMRRADDAADGLNTRTGTLTQGWGRLRTVIAGAVAAIGVRGLARGFQSAIDSTLELSESINAVNVIFEEGSDTVIDFAQSAADAAGLAVSQAQQLVVPIGALLRNFGFDAEQAGQAAVTLTQRAADLASVFNTEVPEALTAIQAALRGEADPLERFGASITAARTEAFALSEGLAASSSEITDAIRLQARYQLILEDTAAAAGDFAATSDEAANRQRILAAEAENAQAELGEALLPAYEEILGIVPGVITAFSDLAPVVADIAQDFADATDRALDFLETLGLIENDAGLATAALQDVNVEAETTGTLFENLGLTPTSGIQAVVEETGGLTEELRELAAAVEDVDDPVETLVDAFAELDPGGAAGPFEDFIVDMGRAAETTDAQFAEFIQTLIRQRDELNLTAGELEVLANLLNETSPDEAGVIRTFLELADVIGLSEPEVEALRDRLQELEIPGLLERDIARFQRLGEAAGDVGPSFQEIEGILDRDIARFQRLGAAAREAGFDIDEGLDPEAQARRLEEFDEALSGVANVAEDTGLSFFTAALNIGFFDSELEPLVGKFDATELAAARFDQALADLQFGLRFDTSNVVEELDLLISKTNEAGDEVPVTVEEMVTDLQEQATRLAEFEAVVAALEALGFDDLAAEIESQGPDATDAATDLLEDLPKAAEMERILEEGGSPGEEYVDILQRALEEGNITPELLELVAQFGSEDVRQQVVNEATELGGLFGQELLDAIDLRTDIRIPVQLIPEIQGSSGGSDPTGTGALDGGGGGAGTGGGGVTFNQTNNFNTTPQPTTDTQRISQSTSNVIRHLE